MVDFKRGKCALISDSLSDSTGNSIIEFEFLFFDFDCDLFLENTVLDFAYFSYFFVGIVFLEVFEFLSDISVI